AASRARAANTKASTIRCTSGQPRVGEAPLNALLAAWRADLNGNTKAIAERTDPTVPETASAGTSATKAIGSETRNANREAPETSRASAPIATPSAPKATAPTPSATTHSSK